jgi:hypothetical protein
VIVSATVSEERGVTDVEGRSNLQKNFEDGLFPKTVNNSASILGFTAALAEPHLREWVQEHIWDVKCIETQEKELVKNWCDFASFAPKF